jgi:histidine triad (HIT) family protein
MASIFTRILQGEIPCYKVAENEHFFAFLDIAPVEIGHTLVIPKQEIDYLFDMPEALYTDLHLFARKVAKALQSVVPCKRIATTVVGLEVPHTHIHLVPLNKLAFINFQATRAQLSPAELQALADKIRMAFETT